MADPTHCDLCKASLDEHGYSFSFDANGKVTEARCRPCDDKKRVEAFKKTKVLVTGLVMSASMHDYLKRNGREKDSPYSEIAEEVMEVYKPIEAEIKLFERDVWFDGLQSFAQKAKTKGTSAAAEEVKLLCYTMCGRAMITLENKNSSVTLITEEDGTENRMGMQGICATGPNAVALLERVRGLWDRGSLVMSEDREVRIAGT